MKIAQRIQIHAKLWLPWQPIENLKKNHKKINRCPDFEIFLLGEMWVSMGFSNAKFGPSKIEQNIFFLISQIFLLEMCSMSLN